MKKLLFKIILLLCFFTPSFLFGANCPSGNLYVDFDTGSDAAAGTATGTAWKHSPGDANATGVANCTLIADNVVNFKGGVKYKGKIDATSPGTSGHPITYQGQPASWGTGKAIIDGTIALEWTVCPDAATCGGNANFASIYYATLPENANEVLPLFDNDTPVYFATYPAQSVLWFYDDATQFFALSSGVGATSTTDSTNLTQADDYWIGAWVMVHISGNGIGSSAITDSGSNAITYGSVGTPMVASSDSKYHYSIFNSVKLIAEANRYAVDTVNSKIFVWPTSGTTNLSVGNLSHGFFTNSSSYLTIDGFIIQGQYGTRTGAGYKNGRAVAAGSTSTDGILVQNCTIRNIQANDASGTVYIQSNGSAQNIVQDNTFSYIQGRGVVAIYDNVLIDSNTFSYLSGTVIYMNQSASGGIISNNNADNCGGTHSNGISVYGQAIVSHDFIVRNNKFINFNNAFGGGALTTEVMYNGLFYNNVFDGVYNDWGYERDPTGYLRFYNNVITGKASLTNIGHDMYEEVTWQGNVLGDLDTNSFTAKSYNIFMGNYAGTLGTGESENVANTDLFTDPANDDFTLKAGSAAIDAFPTASAPTGTFTTDILAISRPQSSAWDIGSYESPAGGGTDYTITPTWTGCSGTPAVGQLVASGNTAEFTVPTGYHSTAVTDTCGTGSWATLVYTSGAATEDCAVGITCRTDKGSSTIGSGGSMTAGSGGSMAF